MLILFRLSLDETVLDAIYRHCTVTYDDIISHYNVMVAFDNSV